MPARSTRPSTSRRAKLYHEARVAALSTLLGLAPAPALARPPIADVHLHVSPTELGRLHSIMDEVGVSYGLNLSGLWPGGPLEEQLAAARRSGRLLVACNLPWFAARRREDFPAIAVELLREAKRLGARALKIEKALGLRVKKPDGSLLAVDDPWLDPIWDEAGRLGLPVFIHTADPRAFWAPADASNERIEELTAHPGWSYYGLPVPSFDALLAAFVRVVERHPRTRFVGVHFGNNAEDPAWVAAQLERLPNLYVDLAARLPELGRHPPEGVRALFLRFQDRILFGTDLGVSEDNFLMLGSYGETPNQRGEVGPFFAAHYRWLEAQGGDMPSMTPIQGRWRLYPIGLPPEVLRKIYGGNAARLLGPPPAGALVRWWRLR